MATTPARRPAPDLSDLCRGSDAYTPETATVAGSPGTGDRGLCSGLPCSGPGAAARSRSLAPGALAEPRSSAVGSSPLLSSALLVGALPAPGCGGGGPRGVGLRAGHAASQAHLVDGVGPRRARDMSCAQLHQRAHPASPDLPQLGYLRNGETRPGRSRALRRSLNAVCCRA
jgi:hypothetical protein